MHVVLRQTEQTEKLCLISMVLFIKRTPQSWLMVPQQMGVDLVYFLKILKSVLSTAPYFHCLFLVFLLFLMVDLFNNTVHIH